MKINLEKLSNLERKLHVEVPLEKVGEALERVYRGIQKQVTIKGFRKGKAPLPTVKSLYKDRVQDDVVRELIQTHYFEALQEHSLEPIGNADFEFDPLIEGQPFKFSAKFEIRPPVQLEQYEGLPVEKEKLEIDESKIETNLQRLRESKASESPMLEERPAQKGDLATIDFAGFMDGQPLENSSASEQTIELGNSGFIPGFDEGIVGMRVGVTNKINLKFPEDYHAGLAGKDVTFEVTLKRLGRKTLPELNDEFAQSVSPFKTLEELKNAIRDEYKASEEARIKKDLKTRLLKVLVDRNPIDVPPSLLKEQKQALIHDMHNRMQQQGISHSEFEEYAKKWDQDFEQSAKFIIQSSFLINAIADKHNLRATDDELDQKLNEYASQTGIEYQKLKEYYSKPERRANMKFQITEEKVVDHLISSAKVREVPASEIKDKDV